MVLKIFCFFVLLVAVSAGYQDDHKHHYPQSYKFGYEIKDHHGSQHRHEHTDGHGHVQGSYGFTDHKGIFREVHYVADHHGFRATVKTNEPGTANQDPAQVKLQSDDHQNNQFHHHGQYQYGYHLHQQHFQHGHHRHGHQQMHHFQHHQEHYAHQVKHLPQNHQYTYNHGHQNHFHDQNNELEYHHLGHGYNHVKHFHGGHL